MIESPVLGHVRMVHLFLTQFVIYQRLFVAKPELSFFEVDDTAAGHLSLNVHPTSLKVLSAGFFLG